MKRVMMTVDVVYDDKKTDQDYVATEMDRMMTTIREMMGPDWFADVGGLEVLPFYPAAYRRRFVDGLHSGDQITWNDPDGGACSRTFKIGTIERRGDILRITDQEDGWEIECYPEEIS